MPYQKSEEGKREEEFKVDSERESNYPEKDTEEQRKEGLLKGNQDVSASGKTGKRKRSGKKNEETEHLKN